MCLQHSTTAITIERLKFWKRTYKVYKLVRIVNHSDGVKIKSPFIHVPINSGWFEATTLQEWCGKSLDGGAIHCFRTMDLAKQREQYENLGQIKEFAVIVCKARKRDLIACNCTEIAFKKIYVPQQEIDRILGV